MGSSDNLVDRKSIHPKLSDTQGRYEAVSQHLEYGEYRERSWFMAFSAVDPQFGNRFRWSHADHVDGLHPRSLFLFPFAMEGKGCGFPVVSLLDVHTLGDQCDPTLFRRKCAEPSEYPSGSFPSDGVHADRHVSPSPVPDQHSPRIGGRSTHRWLQKPWGIVQDPVAYE